MSKILINIAWPYANGPIHLGHVAGSLLPPDIFRRYHRLLGNEVWMVGGSDQHGTPITVTAEKEGVTPEVIAERYHEINKKAIEGLGIEYTLYNKTHCATHTEITQWMFTRLKENGYIYEVEEDEYYCPKCAKFLPDRYVEGECPKCGAKNVRSDQCDSCGTTFVPGDIISPYCTRCGSAPEVRSSKQFSLRLSAFEKPLLETLKKNTYWRPNVKSFTENFLKGGLKDRSITRDMSWGIPIPVEGEEWKSKVIYVWFDAVIGYLSASVEYSRMIGKPDYWKEFWKDPECRSYYFIGKDNIPFHSIIWPAMLMGTEEGLNQPYDIPANEY
ncbi:MAG: methionine--tRNA ligase, partial [Candidatus Methanomethylophilaceae archaeon]|nr:methionine--tRNA ligase [Candidatus Methanomethylophilaceae archaeon]